MVNSRDSLSKIPSTNHDGTPYILDLDIYKEGYWAYDISNYYKGRVDDNGTPFQVRWFEHGQIKNVQGFRPFIRGTVGQHTIDDETDPDNPKVVPSPDCSQIDQTGETTDTMPGGIAVYRMVNQCFTQEGMFYGEIGLKDSSGLVLSSVDIAFKVLGGRMNMVGARKFYVSEFEKALDNLNAIIDKTKKDFSQQLSQVITDARNTYNAQVKNSQDALNALDGEVRANRQEQANLSQRLVGTEQQIAEHDVVTRPEFLNLSNQLTQQVSQMKEAGLEFFNNADDLKAKYPQGANKLCVTLNDSHEWVYDFANNQWNDAGAFNYGTIDPKLTRTIYTKSPDNLIVNSDFNSLDMWHAQRNQTDPNVYIDTSDAINGSNAVVINGYVKDGSNNESWILSKDFPVDTTKNPTISLGLEAYVQGINTQVGDTANLELDMVDKDGNTTRWNRTLANNSDYQKITWENIILPSNTVSCYIGITMYGLGQVKIRRPQANFGSKLLPYSKEELVHANRNLLATSPITTWCWDLNDVSFHVDKNTLYHGSPTLKMSVSALDQWEFPVSPMIRVEPNENLSLVLPLKGTHDYVHGNLYAEINQYENYNSQELESVRYGSQLIAALPVESFEKFTFNNIKISDRTNYITVRVVLYGAGEINIGDVALYQSKYAPETTSTINDYLASKNCFFNYPVKKWRVDTTSSADVSLDPKILDKNDNQTIKILTPNYNLSQTTFIRSSDSPQIKVNGRRLSFKLSYRQKIDWSKGRLIVGLRQYNSQNEPVNFNKELDFVLPNVDELTEKTFTNILLNEDTKYITPFIYAEGAVDANFSNFEQIDNPPMDDNLVVQSNPSTWQTSNSKKYNSQYTILRTDKVEINSNIHDIHEYLFLQSQVIPVQGNQTYTFKIPAYIAPADQNNIYLAVEQGATVEEARDNKSETMYYFRANEDYKTYTFSLTTKPNTNFISFRLVWHSAGLAKFGNLHLYLGTPNQLGADKVATQVLPQFTIKGAQNITDKWTKAPFNYIDGKRKITGYLQYAMQGSSSRDYPKKNLKLKFFSDENYKKKLKWKPKSDWDKNNKYNLKANYIDATQARNLANSKVFAKATAITPFEHNSQKGLLNTQNLGQMEGFPVELYFNGDYYGLMTLNTKKDDKPYGLDSDNPATEGIQCEQPGSNFSDPKQKLDGNSYSTIVQDKASETLQTNFNKFLTFINTSSDQDFKNHLHEYIDIKSAMNCMLWGVLAHMWDYPSKSIILLTWNSGVDFYLTLYDMDSTWNLYWNGSKLTTEKQLDFSQPTKLDLSWGNKLYSRIFTNFKSELKAQYEFLRKNVWSNAQIISVFKEFIHAIPEEAYEREQEKWADIPSKDITDFAQIQQSIITRGNAMDEYMSKLVPEADPLEDIKARLTNLEHNGTAK